MRPRRASASNGVLNKRVRLSHETLLLGLMAVIALWMIGSLVQEVALNRSLGRQTTALQQQNGTLQSGNSGYRRDIAAVSSGAASEEEARKDGYARSDEKLYIVATPPPATPSPAARRPRPGPAGPGGPLAALWRFVTGLPGG